MEAAKEDKLSDNLMDITVKILLTWFTVMMVASSPFTPTSDKAAKYSNLLGKIKMGAQLFGWSPF